MAVRDDVKLAADTLPRCPFGLYVATAQVRLISAAVLGHIPTDTCGAGLLFRDSVFLFLASRQRTRSTTSRLTPSVCWSPLATWPANKPRRRARRMSPAAVRSGLGRSLRLLVHQRIALDVLGE